MAWPPRTTNQEKILSILGLLTQEKIHLPGKYSLGIFKGLMIVTNEDYAKYVPAGFIEDRIKSFVKKELIVGSIANCLRRFLK